MRKNFNRLILVIIAGLFIVVAPWVVAKIMNIQYFNWMKNDNDWIGFWGSYLGGFITLIGVFLTIKYAREEEINRQKLAIRPYINIEHIYNCDIAGFTATPLGFVYFEGKNVKNEYSLRINKLIILCAIKNVGLGTAINCRIKRLDIENKCLNFKKGSLPSLQVDGNSFIRIELMEIDLQKEDLSSRFVTENKRLSEPSSKQGDSKIFIKLDLTFEDLLGNNLTQEYVISIQVIENVPVNIPDLSPLNIESISKPKEH